MSFVLDDNTDPNADPSQSQAADNGTSLGGGGSGVVSAGGGGNVGGANQTAQSQATKPSSSGSWTNLQSYLDANADQGAKVGGDIAGTVSGQAQTAQNDVDSASSDFTKNVNDNTVNSDPNAVNQAITDATSATAGGTFNPDDVTNFQKQANASYNGPTDFTKQQGYGQAQQDINTAQASLAQTGSEAGRDVLLGNQYAHTSENGYNQGEKNLDQLLLEGSSGGRAALEPLQSQWSGLGSALSNATAASATAVQNAQATDAATAKAAQDALSGANSNFQSGVQNQFSTLQANNQKATDQVRADLASGKISAQEAQALGLNDQEQYYNLNPNDYLTTATNPTLYNSASADQYAQARALAQLAGQSDSNFLSSATANQAGTGLGNPYGFDAARFNSDAVTAKGNYNSALIPFFGQNGAFNGGASQTPEQMLASKIANIQTLKASGAPAEVIQGMQSGVDQLQSIINTYGGKFNLIQDAIT